MPFLKHFDICLIPFVKNAVTDAVSPVKLFEYFSAGKPVVTTDLAECAKYPPIHVGGTHERFISMVRSILVAYPTNPDAGARQIALDNTWHHRICQIKTAMQEAASPKISCNSRNSMQ
jgi:hypothetical protein